MKNNQETFNKMSISIYIDILNVNGLNAPIKRLRASERLKK